MSATLQGPRIALQVARAWCALIERDHVGAVTIDDARLEFTGWDLAALEGLQLSRAVHDEDESRAGAPFICHGPGVEGPKEDPIAGAVEGPGVFIAEPAPLHTKLLHPTNPIAFATRYCSEWASKRGIAGVIGQSVVVTDFAGVHSRIEAESK